jgi:uridylate kinase
MAKPIYRRAIVKISGEVLGGESGGFGIDHPTLERIAADLVAARALGVTLAVVVGGGNFVRGASASQKGLPRVTGDLMGMLATVMNALALEAAIEALQVPARTMSALAMPEICETYERRRAARHLAEGRVLLLAAGTGNPFFTTDTAAALRAAEMQCDALLKGTQVDGVYSADPRKVKDATRFEQLTYLDVLANDLGVMDAAAISLARENHLPIIVFNIHAPGAFAQVMRGEGAFTKITE